jgi:3'-phosphoadenosine 5'-phosphosulfate sulfotransferase (PAPS reductase)/FAD synthetase
MPIVLPEASAYLIAYSGGKDSLALLDLAVNSGRRVEAFFMYFLAGMDYTAHWVKFAEHRWGIRVHTFLHWNTIQWLRSGLFRHEPLQIRKLTVRHIEDAARAASGIEWIGYGYKSRDSLHRRGMINAWPGGICPVSARGKIFAPLKDWSDNDVRAYLDRNRLPQPITDGTKRNSGIGLGPFSLEWLRAEWPDDYQRILKVFPYACAHADRAPRIRAQIEEAQKTNRAHGRIDHSPSTVRVSSDPALAHHSGAV